MTGVTKRDLTLLLIKWAIETGVVSIFKESPFYPNNQMYLD
jgi:hypothetical protein